MIEGSLNAELHPRTFRSTFAFVAAGWVAGLTFSYPVWWLLVVSIVLVTLGVWHLPSAQTVAIEWREAQRIEEERP